MSKWTMMGIAAGVVLAGGAPAGASVILLDFSNNSASTTAITDPSRTWNNLNDEDAGDSGQISLLYTDGTDSGAKAEVTNSFYYHGNNGHTLSGYPDSATKDYFYSYRFFQSNAWSGDQTGAITFSGFDPATAYNFTIYGSKGGNDYDDTSTYTLAGLTTSSSVYATANSNASLLTFNNVLPDSSGNFVLTVKGPSDAEIEASDVNVGAAALNFVQIESVPEPASLSLLGMGGLMMLARRRRRVEAA